MKDMYIVVKLTDAKKLAEIIREEVFEEDGAHAYVLCDLEFRLREVAPLLKRIDNESGADIKDIVDQLKHMDICPACAIEGQQHSCSAHDARKLGRRLKRLLDRAENEPSGDKQDPIQVPT